MKIEFQFYYSICDSVRNCVRYSTKEDFECMFKNLDTKLFHINFHIFYWTLETASFSILDSFIQKNLHYVNYIESKFYEYKRMKTQKNCLYEIHCFKNFNNWRDLVVNWYNDFINKRTSKQLYIHGLPDTGKSFFIFSLYCKLFT